MTREMAVFCDETGTHDCDYFGWGSIWCPLDKINSIDHVIGRICREFNERREVKWSRVGHGSSRQKMVRWFFHTPWICFQSLLVRKDTMHIFDGGKRQVAYRKLLCTMLATQMKRFNALPGGPRRFTIYVDQTGSTTKSLTRNEFQILTAAARKKTGSQRDLVRNFRRIDSRSRRGIQLADLFIGALRASWEGRPKAQKKAICQSISKHLGWKNLRGITTPNLKFNIWLHHDSYDASPHIKSRILRLRNEHGDPERLFGLTGARR